MKHHAGKISTGGSQEDYAKNEDRIEYFILAMYVDDLVITGTTQKGSMTFKQQPATK